MKSNRQNARDSILDALDGVAARRRPPLSYRLSLMLVSLVVVLMPLIYAGIVAALGWGVYWYGANGGEILEGLENSRAYVFVRFGPLIVGTVLVFFLLKPFLARPAKGPEPTSLDPEDEPFLFDFVDQLAEHLGAPAPERIDVNLDVNASASFANGLRGFFDGKLVLTLGLPLVSGLKLRELTAVLAHEFGHFSQGAGMRFYYLTRLVNHWFARAVFQRDSWDERLEKWSENGMGITVLIFSIARMGVWASRKLLLLLLKMASAASSLMSRQMEFDADRNAIHLCGTKSFAHSMELLPQIEAASQWAASVNNNAFSEGRIAEDIPGLIQEGLESFSEDDRNEMVAQVMDSTVDMYATHPPTRERVDQAETLAEKGSFRINGPSGLLFEDFGGLCRQMTADFYESLLGSEFHSDLLVPVANVLSQNEGLQREGQWALEFFVGAPMGPTSLGMEPVDPGPAADLGRTVKRLGNLRHEAQELQKQLPDPELAVEADTQWARATAAGELLSRRFTVRDPDYHVAGKAKIQSAVRRWEQKSEELRSRTELSSVQRKRIRLCLEALATPEVMAKVEGGAEGLERGVRLANCLAALPPVSDYVFEMRRRLEVISWATSQLDDEDEAALDRFLGSQARRLEGLLGKIREAAGELPYPLEHANEDILLRDYLVPSIPEDPRSLALQGNAAQGVIQSWGMLLHRMLGSLAGVCLQTEAALGFEPLNSAPSEGVERAPARS